ncbi:oxidoreductase C-terminal domain-containing protein [Streptomyces violaceoruber]|uniref:oxidoreductase C-terminal domain-containing protein n=2 Tax=Streptomyces violaceoruber group TaxID=2867121 RepID=UPI00403C1860
MSGDRVLAGMSVNLWDGIGTIRALIESGAETDDAALADPSVPLESLLPPHARPTGDQA